MHDKPLIIAILVVFIVLVTLPFWYTFGAGGDTAPPDLEMPDPALYEHCIEDTDWMRANHMKLLDDWRDRVVRDGERDYTSVGYGTKYKMSLTNTCMKCHTNRETFCFRCHDHAHVESMHRLQGSSPDDPMGVRCWSCHQAPEVEPKGD